MREIIALVRARQVDKLRFACTGAVNFANRTRCHQVQCIILTIICMKTPYVATATV